MKLAWMVPRAAKVGLLYISCCVIVSCLLVLYLMSTSHELLVFFVLQVLKTCICVHRSSQSAQHAAHPSTPQFLVSRQLELHRWHRVSGTQLLLQCSQSEIWHQHQGAQPHSDQHVTCSDCKHLGSLQTWHDYTILHLDGLDKQTAVSCSQLFIKDSCRYKLYKLNDDGA